MGVVTGQQVEKGGVLGNKVLWGQVRHTEKTSQLTPPLEALVTQFKQAAKPEQPIAVLREAVDALFAELRRLPRAEELLSPDHTANSRTEFTQASFAKALALGQALLLPSALDEFGEKRCRTLLFSQLDPDSVRVGLESIAGDLPAAPVAHLRLLRDVHAALIAEDGPISGLRDLVERRRTVSEQDLRKPLTVDVPELKPLREFLEKYGAALLAAADQLPFLNGRRRSENLEHLCQIFGVIPEPESYAQLAMAAPDRDSSSDSSSAGNRFRNLQPNLSFFETLAKNIGRYLASHTEEQTAPEAPELSEAFLSKHPVPNPTQRTPRSSKR
jgi:hypothetical protein